MPSEFNVRKCRVLSNLSGEEVFLPSTEDWQVIYTNDIKKKTKETRLQKSYKISNPTGVTFICTNNFFLHILALPEEKKHPTSPVFFFESGKCNLSFSLCYSLQIERTTEL